MEAKTERSGFAQRDTWLIIFLGEEIADATEEFADKVRVYVNDEDSRIVLLITGLSS
jgi:hypothetical protein